MTERRLVVVSNRVPPPSQVEGQPRAAGGLANALQPALRTHGALWFGWSGHTGDPAAPPVHASDGAVEYVTIDLSEAELAGYYEGFSNRTLWPLMHGLPDRAHIEPEQYALWRRVNVRFASALRPLLREGDLVWVHDYHLIPCGEALRAAGWTGRLGYFHHIPIPAEEHWRQIPNADALTPAFAAYDLVGVQTERDAQRLRDLIEAEKHGITVGAYPIGIDPAHVRALAAAHPGDPFEESRRGRQVLLGLDRLDYSKGVPQRLLAFEQLLARDETTRREALLVQWSAPSRETIPEYEAERRAAEEAATRIEVNYPDDQPVQFTVSTLPAEMVAAGLRDADVCLVTSLADGMNLVALEFVAAQTEERPGVLILSDTCGAAETLHDALIVHAADVASIEEAMARALAMPHDKRVERWRALLNVVEEQTADAWYRHFVNDLEG
jgi:trehalose 6-phosphate synthase